MYCLISRSPQSYPLRTLWEWGNWYLERDRIVVAGVCRCSPLSRYVFQRFFIHECHFRVINKINIAFTSQQIAKLTSLVDPTPHLPATSSSSSSPLPHQVHTPVTNAHAHRQPHIQVRHKTDDAPLSHIPTHELSSKWHAWFRTNII